MSESKQQHTPTPWTWQDFGYGLILTSCASGRPIVMDFVRKGMNRAEPRFGKRTDSMGGIMVPLSKWQMSPPDLEFITRAVNSHEALLAACKAALEARNEYNGPCDHDPEYGVDCLQCELRSAISLAEKES